MKLQEAQAVILKSIPLQTQLPELTLLSTRLSKLRTRLPISAKKTTRFTSTETQLLKGDLDTPDAKSMAAQGNFKRHGT